MKDFSSKITTVLEITMTFLEDELPRKVFKEYCTEHKLKFKSMDEMFNKDRSLFQKFVVDSDEKINDLGQEISERLVNVYKNAFSELTLERKNTYKNALKYDVLSELGAIDFPSKVRALTKNGAVSDGYQEIIGGYRELQETLMRFFRKVSKEEMAEAAIAATQ